MSYVLDYLADFPDITVITNSPKASLRLAEMKIKCFCTGGLLLENSIAYVGTHAENFIRRFNADILFFSCRGISETGVLTDTSIEETELRRAMIDNSKKRIFLCTSDKLGKKYMYNVTDFRKIDKIICDADIPNYGFL